jgi:Enoyl-CoA hydratase/carnithine racemase
MTQHSMFKIETVAPKIRRVTFSNPPVNVVGADTVVQLVDVVNELSRDEEVQVVVFDSGTPGYFFNHADLGQVPELLALNSADGTPTWVELVTRLTSAPFISIASIRGRTRGEATRSPWPSTCATPAARKPSSVSPKSRSASSRAVAAATV